jgi:hypothetical protein
VCSFIAGLFIGAFIGIILFSLMAAGKQNGISYDIDPDSKVKHPFADQAEKDISNG